MDSQTLSLSLTVADGHAALDFYAKAFGAEKIFKMEEPDGGVAHAEFFIKGTKVYLSEASDEFHAYPMPAGTMASCLFSLATENCDVDFQKAVQAGAKSLSEPEDKFWGARCAVILDPFGYRWCLVHTTEKLTAEEIAQRAAQLFSSP